MTLPLVPRHQVAEAAQLGRRELLFDLDLHARAEGLDAGTSSPPDGIHLHAMPTQHAADRVLLTRGKAHLLRQIGDRVGIAIGGPARGECPAPEAPAHGSAKDTCRRQERPRQPLGRVLALSAPRRARG